ncbi:MAG: creatininase family protein [Pseudomonadota bacterium]|nr:creatininase family protein [Pseudomonadota bacterium]
MIDRGMAVALLMCAVTGFAQAAAAPVAIEALTSTELRERIAAGATTVLFPIGGTEQNGAHMVLGKHNVRATVLAERIARQLGDAVVAPVLAYVPEGSIEPPAGHMQFAGTISIPAPVFEATLVAAVQSLRKHGLCDVYFLGDHGGYRGSLDKAAATLNRSVTKRAAQRTGCHASAMPTYYRAASADFDARLRQQGHSAAEIGKHAGLADTALAMAVDPALVRSSVGQARPDADGVSGDPRRATALIGEPGIEHIVAATVAAIRADRQARP